MTENNTSERPAQMPKRVRAKTAASKPQAASDENVDPAEVERPQEPPLPKFGRQQPTVQMAVRVPEYVAELVAHAAIRQGVTKRQVIEDLVRKHLGDGR